MSIENKITNYLEFQKIKHKTLSGAFLHVTFINSISVERLNQVKNSEVSLFQAEK
jgi:hypothetical protein